MRFHTTLPFSAKRRAASDAYAVFSTEFDRDDSSAATKRASLAEGKAIEEMLVHPALTPKEVQTKLELVFERDVLMWDFGPAAAAALVNDLQRLQGHPVSPMIAEALAAWRATHEAWSLAGDDEDGKGDAHSAAYHVLMETPCTTAGDFMAKAYVNLLGDNGSTLHGEAKADLTGNLFDIDIDQAVNMIDQGEVWQRAAYADLDASDLGANLLAYGLPHFSAEHWLERADAVGLQVSAIIHEDGGRGFCQSFPIHDGPNSARIDREWDRLHRLAAFPEGNRVQALIAEIEAEWPQLVRRSSLPSPSKPNTEKAA